MSRNLLMIVASDARAAAETETELEPRLKAAFRAVQGHWLVTDEKEQFLGALAGVMELYGAPSPEYEQIRRSARILGDLFAGRFDSLFAAEEEDFTPLPLNPWWNEMKREKAA